MVGNFAFLYNCTLVGQTSDSMMVPTKSKEEGTDQELIQSSTPDSEHHMGK